MSRRDSKKRVAIKSLVKKQEQQSRDGNLTLSKQLIGRLRKMKEYHAPGTPNRPKRDQFKNVPSLHRHPQVEGSSTEQRRTPVKGVER